MNLTLDIPAHFIVPDRVVSLEEIQRDIDHLDKLLLIRFDTSNMEEMSEHLEELMSWFSKSTDLVASANFYRDVSHMLEYNRVAEIIKAKDDLPKQMNGIVSSSILKDYISSRNASFNYLATKSERLNRALTHKIGGIRSLLSKEREVYKITNAPVRNY